MTMLFLLLLVIWPIAELLVAIEVAQAIGFLPMLLLLVLSWPLGLWVVRHHGRLAWRRLGEAVSAGRPPTREVVDGALVVLGGGLLIVPGFITDVLGLLLLAPPTRWLARRELIRNFHSRVVIRATSFGAGRTPYDVDSTATDIDNPQLPR
jgi:UPF0716 protein FxsA